MDSQVILSTFIGAMAGALAGSLPVILLTWWLTVSARKSAARSQRRTEQHLEGINGALQRMAYWGGFDAERQVEADLEAAHAEAGEAEEGDHLATRRDGGQDGDGF